LTRWTLLLVMLAALISAPGALAHAELPAVVRPSLTREGSAPEDVAGLAFFLASDAPPGAVAVSTAHTIPLSRLVDAQRVDFRLAGSHRPVTSSQRLIAPPGRPFSLPGATLRGDYVIFALAQPPVGVRVLEATPQEVPVVGTRVRILGAPPRASLEQDDAYGRIVQLSPTRIDVDLDVPQDLAGWGGGPIVVARSGRVIGMLEAHVPHGPTARVLAAPIGGVLAALADPLDAGAGRVFAAFAGSAEPPPAKAPQRAEKPHMPLIASSDSGPTEVHLGIEYPAEGGVVADSICGVLVAGRAHALRGSQQRFDVVLVLDTSRSTIDPTGADINGNGVVGRQRLGAIGSIFGSGSTDPGDSILAAEVAAARQVLRGLDPRNTRIAVVAFAGDPGSSGVGRRGRRAAYTLEPLTREYARIQHALDQLLRREPEGSTHMAAGVDQATIELLGLRGAASRPDAKAEKVVFFFTDGQPTLPYGPEMEADNVRAVLRAANRARRGGIRIHAFAIGPDALDGPIATVEMASRTDGYFMPVRHPGDLVNLVEDVNFAKLAGIEIISDTTQESAHLVRITADGAWAGLLPMRPGENRIRVRARADDGAQTEQTRTVTFVPEAPTPPIPAAYVVHRNRLLEDCLRETKQLRLQAERDHAEQVRRELQVEIERERATARERAAAQRKRLELEVDDDEGVDVSP